MRVCIVRTGFRLAALPGAGAKEQPKARRSCPPVRYEISQEFGSHNVAGVLAWTLVFAIALSVTEYS
jgi:hypothetical protein